MEFKTNYPYVFVHGMFGFGPDSRVFNFVPYFGLFGGSITEYFNKHGMEAYDAAVGPYSSAWDRACELYAQLTGTRVDYGKAHSERFGHERFGRTYSRPLFEGWGQPDENGDIKKVNFMGHSFGGTTTRLLISLLATGCTAEQQATDPSDISPLFVGGKADWVFSETTYATPHNGLTLFAALGTLERPFKKLIYGAGNMLNNTPISKLYDFKLDQFGLTTEPVSTFRADIDREKIEAVADSKDNIFFDLSIAGAAEVNSHVRWAPQVYYFSYAGSRTKSGLTGKRQKPARNMFLPFKVTGSLIGVFKNDPVKGVDVDSEWLANDGIVNTVSAMAPDTEPSTDFNMVKEVRPGIWYKMGVLDMDHMTFCGYGIPHEDICEFYYKHAVGINNL